MSETTQYPPAETGRGVAPILVIGSNGKTGSRISRLLTERGLAVRAGSRSAQPAFDWEQAHSWPAAIEGVKVAYICYYPDLISDAAASRITGLTRAMRAAGVESVVLLSGRGEAGAERAENIVRDSDLKYTLVRASWFTQNFSEGHLREPLLEGVIALPAGESVEPFVDVDDIAEVAVAALEAYAHGDDRHNGELYEVTGPRLISFAEAAAVLALVVGRPVDYIAMGFDDYHAELAAVAGTELADLFTELCREVFDGRNEHLGDGVQRALGRPPRDFAETIAAAAASGAWAPSEAEAELVS